jgi:hypothetical protein
MCGLGACSGCAGEIRRVIYAVRFVTLFGGMGMVWLRRSCFPVALVLVAGCSSTSVTQVSAQSSGGAGGESVGGGQSSSGGNTLHAGGGTAVAATTGGTDGLGGTSSAAGNGSLAGSTSQAGAGFGGMAATGGQSPVGGAAGGGTKATGGLVATGGAGAGGASTGGGMKATGGVVATGGAATAVGGAATGGTKATGGNAATGGRAAGGAATGGAATGGRATGGAATGGAATGGRATGGAGTGGTPPTWCQTQATPTGVTTADYQCIDFDTGMPPTATWAQTLTNSGTMARTTTRASSAPDSLSASVPSAADYTTAGSATLSWQDVGSTPIGTIAVSASLSPVTVGGVASAWTGSVSLMCVAFGSGQACLSYTYGSTNLSFQSTAYTGYYIAWLYSGGPATRQDCAITGSLTANIWTRVDLRVDSATDTITVQFAGTTVGSCAGAFGADTVSTTTVGPKAYATTTYAYNLYYDNVVAYILRQ